MADPAVAGPFAIAEQNVSRYAVAATSSNVNLFVVGPTAAGAPVPVVLMAPGFALSIDQFKETARYVARHGFVVLLTSYNINVFAPDHAKAAQEMRGALDFLSTDATWSARADLQNIGTSGHSLGGKLAVLVAAQDTRVKASMTMDPVDGTQMPDASSMLPLAMPMGFLGETTDATSTGMACAPAAQNYTTFYDAASAPALEVTVLGANHMSFLDDVASCGITCAFCNDATATNADVLSLSRAYLVAFFQRYLRGNTAYDAYLVGSEAQARYVATSRATLRSR